MLTGELSVMSISNSVNWEIELVYGISKEWSRCTEKQKQEVKKKKQKKQDLLVPYDVPVLHSTHSWKWAASIPYILGAMPRHLKQNKTKQNKTKQNKTKVSLLMLFQIDSFIDNLKSFKSLGRGPYYLSSWSNGGNRLTNQSLNTLQDVTRDHSEKTRWLVDLGKVSHQK